MVVLERSGLTSNEHCIYSQTKDDIFNQLLMITTAWQLASAFSVGKSFGVAYCAINNLKEGSWTYEVYCSMPNSISI